LGEAVVERQSTGWVAAGRAAGAVAPNWVAVGMAGAARA
jgi:hypothetical protein